MLLFALLPDILYSFFSSTAAKIVYSFLFSIEKGFQLKKISLLSKSVPSLVFAEKMTAALDISIDELVYGKSNEKARIQISDNELLNLFNKTQSLEEDQKKSVVDLLSAFLLKANLTKQLA